MRKLWWFFVGFALAFVLGTLGCATARPADAPQGHSLAAFTTWDCDDATPAVFLSTDIIGRHVEQEIRIHEAKHVEQAQRFGCVLWRHLYTTNVAFRAAVEAEAMCAQMRYAMKADGVSYEDAITHYGAWYFRGYHFTADSASATAMIASACPDISQHE